ncbi:Fpg/Nei family DNA glycosylase [Zafaria sp. Z1313]|uniref:Fpg/Nei family DNA glycosylase n=1 Tax=unclassified Zafaria TaxID=2828765 RepID=UPI002E76539B|nr:DNA-formamidopyrimidine glycosylase family protein [Zafaria sp. J156]MEE1620642.1 DNA-formamidopyrimidine glycosylase family protein [Zafaria sp. J156]
MPEGHSIHRLARQFNDVFAGSRLRVSSPQGRFSADARRVDGRTLESAGAHGKMLFLRFDNDLTLRVHLGLYGAWDFGGDEGFRGASSIGAPRRVGEREAYDDGAPVPYAGPPEPVGQVRARLESGHGWADLRGPSACEVLDDAGVAAVLGRLGPDPLGPAPDDAVAGAAALPVPVWDDPRAEFARRLVRRATPVAVLLMEQSVIAGVGNIYRAEALFRERMDPWATGRQAGVDAARRLWDDLASIMADGVRDGRIITTRPGDRSGAAPVWPDDAYYVYQRQGLGCRVCGTGIALAEIASRKLYWCPACQGREGRA